MNKTKNHLEHVQNTSGVCWQCVSIDGHVSVIYPDSVFFAVRHEGIGNITWVLSAGYYVLNLYGLLPVHVLIVLIVGTSSESNWLNYALWQMYLDKCNGVISVIRDWGFDFKTISRLGVT